MGAQDLKPHGELRRHLANVQCVSNHQLTDYPEPLLRNNHRGAYTPSLRRNIRRALRIGLKAQKDYGTAERTLQTLPRLLKASVWGGASHFLPRTGQ